MKASVSANLSRLGVGNRCQEFRYAIRCDPGLPLVGGRSAALTRWWFHHPVVVSTEKEEVVQRGGASFLPRKNVMGLAVRLRCVASREGTSFVSVGEGVTKVAGDRPCGATQI